MREPTNPSPDAPKDPATEVRDVFISHRGADNAWVEELGEWLQLNGCKVWIDNLDIQPGESIPGAINRGLEISRHVALVMTPAYFGEDSEWPTAEWHAALFSDPDARRSRVIPLCVKDCSYIPPLLAHLRWIDFRDKNNLKKARAELLHLLQGKPARFPRQVAGQTITLGGNISKETLFIERAAVNGDADPVEERLASNLLPAIRIPQYVWSVPISKGLAKETDRGIMYPSKRELKEIIRKWQEEQKTEHRSMPAFTRHEDRLWTLHNPNRAGHPLTPISENTGIIPMKVSDLIRIADDRRLLSELLMMSVSRYCYHLGLVRDEKERFLFPCLDGKDVAKKWKLRNPAERTVTKRYTRKDGTTNFYYHDALWLRAFFLDGKFFLRLKPTLAFSDDGTENTIWVGPRVGPLAMHWMARQQNIDVFRDLRFWIYQLAEGRSVIRIHAGDQGLDLDTRPAYIHVRGGIEDDQSNIEELLERLPVMLHERESELNEHLEMPEEPDGDL